MLAKNMIAEIKDTAAALGVNILTPEFLHYFQTTHDFDHHTWDVNYDPSLQTAKSTAERVIGRIYMPTAKKMLNSAYSWAKREQLRLRHQKGKISLAAVLD